MTTDNCSADPKREEKSVPGLYASSFCVNWQFVNTCEKSISCPSLWKTYLVSRTVYLYSVEETKDYDDNFERDSKHILHYQSLNIYYWF